MNSFLVPRSNPSAMFDMVEVAALVIWFRNAKSREKGRCWVAM